MLILALVPSRYLSGVFDFESLVEKLPTTCNQEKYPRIRI